MGNRLLRGAAARRIVFAGLATLLCACSGAIDADRQPDAWPRMPAERLVAALRTLVPVAKVDGDRCVVRLGMHTTELVGVTEDGKPIAFCCGTRLALDDQLLRRGRLDETLALARKVLAAQPPRGVPTGGITAAHGTARFDPLFGVVLVFGDSVVTVDRNFARSRDDAAADRRLALRAALDDALAAARRAPSELDDGARGAFDSLLARASLPDGEAGEDIAASSARRMLRHGAARLALGNDASVPALERAVRDATTPIPDETWRDGTLRVDRGVDLFGAESIVLRDARGSRLAIRAPRDAYAGTGIAFPSDGWLVVDVAAGIDPLEDFDHDAVRGAHLFEDGVLIAHWTPGTGATFDRTIWRRAVNVDEIVRTARVPHDFLPPHVAIQNVHGDLLALVTRHGVLTPPASTSQAEIARFLDDAAQQVKDLAHLDLLARWFVEYARDGADAGRPWLPGTTTWQGDHGASVTGLLATASGGVARGDCEDLAGLVLELLARQDKTGEELGLPSHSAAVWTEITGATAIANVVQSGLPRSFAADDVEHALGLAATALDPWVVFDPRAVRVLRRSGDARLAREVRIDARAFASPARARLERQVLDDLDSGLLGVAAEFLGNEVLRAEDDSEPGLLRRLGDLRLLTCEPRGAIALLDRAATQEAHPVARFSIARDALLAAADCGAEQDLGDRIENLVQSARDDLAGETPIARTLAVADAAQRLLRRGSRGIAARLVVARLAPELDELLGATPARDAATRDTRLLHVVALAASLAPDAAEPEPRTTLVRVLERVLAAPDSTSDATRAVAECGALRVRLGDERFFALAASRDDADAHSPLEDADAWSRFDRVPECWLTAIEDLLDGRATLAAPGDLAAIAVRARRGFHVAAGANACRARTDLWCTLMSAALADGDATRDEALEDASRRFDREAVETALARLARGGLCKDPLALARAWSATLHEDAALSRIAWLAVRDGASEFARALATEAATRGDERTASLRRREAGHVTEAIERLARLRASSAPPK